MQIMLPMNYFQTALVLLKQLVPSQKDLLILSLPGQERINVD